MLLDTLRKYKIILASGSPRRQQFFKDLKIPFEVRLKNVDEVYPENLKGKEISDYLAELKASPQKETLLANEILITSDTVVWHNNESLAKAANKDEAYEMLQKLSGDWHQVITSVCFTTSKKQKTVNHTTKVKFKELSDAEIWYYIENYKPFDKAGAYGIQEWIGLIAIEKIKGSYTNVVGLPTQLVYNYLEEITK
ncbi:septum formation protein [Maribacter vaceletii]|uniref:dTTP/UTP pyrophosphatase n=1 Tax=Maribacter vaceletii TaxID=1206816 RepID=A0A495E7E2_9FLAO|nr:Maf-like protein [Maribacter vaceletii]RKR12862.1 septum formation protein [Maribacter vaceletii]